MITFRIPWTRDIYYYIRPIYCVIYNVFARNVRTAARILIHLCIVYYIILYHKICACVCPSPINPVTGSSRRDVSRTLGLYIFILFILIFEFPSIPNNLCELQCLQNTFFFRIFNYYRVYSHFTVKYFPRMLESRTIFIHYWIQLSKKIIFL